MYRLELVKFEGMVYTTMPHMFCETIDDCNYYADKYMKRATYSVKRKDHSITYTLPDGTITKFLIDKITLNTWELP